MEIFFDFILADIKITIGVIIACFFAYFIYLMIKQYGRDVQVNKNNEVFKARIKQLNTELQSYGYVVAEQYNHSEDEGRIEDKNSGYVVGNYIRLNSEYTGGDEIYRFELKNKTAANSILDLNLSAKDDNQLKKPNNADQEFSGFIDDSKAALHQLFSRNGVMKHFGVKTLNESHTVTVKDKVMKLEKGSAVIPVLNTMREVISYQVIDKDGNKKMRIGTSIKGGFFNIGSVNAKEAKRYILCEEYLSAATLHRSTSETVLVCFDIQNMFDVAKEILALNKGNEVVFAAARDILVWGQPRMRKALYYSNMFNMPFIFPKFKDESKYEHFKTWNELQRYASDGEIKEMVSAQISYFKNTGKKNTIRIMSDKYGLS